MKRLVDIVRPMLSDGLSSPWQVPQELRTTPIHGNFDIRERATIRPIDDVGTKRRDVGAGFEHADGLRVMYIAGTALPLHVTIDFSRVHHDTHPVLRPRKSISYALREGLQEALVGQVSLDEFGVTDLALGMGTIYCEPVNHPVPPNTTRRLSLRERQADRLQGYSRRELLTVTRKEKPQVADEQVSRMFDELALRLLHPRGIPAAYQTADGTFHHLPSEPTKLKISGAYHTPHAIVNARQVMNYVRGRTMFSAESMANYCAMLNRRLEQSRHLASGKLREEALNLDVGQLVTTAPAIIGRPFPTYDREELSEMMELRAGKYVA